MRRVPSRQAQAAPAASTASSKCRSRGTTGTGAITPKPQTPLAHFRREPDANRLASLCRYPLNLHPLGLHPRPGEVVGGLHPQEAVRADAKRLFETDGHIRRKI